MPQAPPATTLAGHFPIGFRQIGGRGWCHDPAAIAAWAGEHRFEFIDVTSGGLDAARAMLDAGLSVASLDLPGWGEMLHTDPAVRDRRVADNTRFVLDAVALGVRVFFVILKPHDAAQERRATFDIAVDSYARLAAAVEASGAKLAIEGWPGPGVIGCTPADVRALFDAVPSAAMAYNYDPSHLIRMGIDPLRFAREFARRIAHVHGKDTAVDSERQYDLGTEQPPTFPEPRKWAGSTWRYCLPGHGHTPWTDVLDVLRDAGYTGRVSIEMEDARFGEDEAAQQRGVRLARSFL